MTKKTKKEEMCYNPKPKQRTCSNCVHFRSEFIESQYGYREEKNTHCAIGAFSVKKTANCNFHEFKQ